VDDLVKWLRAQLDEDERIARAVGEERWQPHYVDSVNDHPDTATVRVADGADVAVMERYSYQDAEHIARHDPARVLREIDAKRKRLAALAEAIAAGHDSFDLASELLPLEALPYVDRPGYREEWRP
jgi:hypothetical protein